MGDANKRESVGLEGLAGGRWGGRSFSTTIEARSICRAVCLTVDLDLADVAGLEWIRARRPIGPVSTAFFELVGVDQQLSWPDE